MSDDENKFDGEYFFQMDRIIIIMDARTKQTMISLIIIQFPNFWILFSGTSQTRDWRR